jgi:hypothetical protein
MANFKVGRLFSDEGKDFDITVIMNWPTEEDYEKATDDNFPGPNLVNFYFGDTNERDTTEFISQFMDRQDKFKELLIKLIELKCANPSDTEIDKQIAFVKEQIVNIY